MQGDYGDVTARKALRERLQCKSFDWFIRNIYPELFIPGDAIASGEVRNLFILLVNVIFELRTLQKIQVVNF